eukprot:m.260289 g.260289  ORF g.260289 m.260289 type:complete len:109 (-) comp23497_c0_seq1:138-464(-)
MQLQNHVYVDKFCKISEDGAITYSPRQKELALEQGVKDVIDAISDMVKVYGREVVTYAVYHRERYSIMSKDRPSYNEFITWIACRFLTDTRFMPPAVSWPLYVWTPAR